MKKLVIYTVFSLLAFSCAREVQTQTNSISGSNSNQDSADSMSLDDFLVVISAEDGSETESFGLTVSDLNPVKHFNKFVENYYSTSSGVDWGKTAHQKTVVTNGSWKNKSGTTTTVNHRSSKQDFSVRVTAAATATVLSVVSNKFKGVDARQILDKVGAMERSGSELIINKNKLQQQQRGVKSSPTNWMAPQNLRTRGGNSVAFNHYSLDKKGYLSLEKKTEPLIDPDSHCTIPSVPFSEPDLRYVYSTKTNITVVRSNGESVEIPNCIPVRVKCVNGSVIRTGDMVKAYFKDKFGSEEFNLSGTYLRYTVHPLCGGKYKKSIEDFMNKNDIESASESLKTSDSTSEALPMPTSVDTGY